MNLPPIRERWLAAKQAKIKQFPHNNLRASSVGHTCDRFHYHSIHDWREKVLHDPILQSIYDEGNLHEIDVNRQLINDMGFQVVEQQRSFQMDKPLITGHIDGILRWEGKDFPYDTKSIAAYDFDKIEAAEDLLLSKKVHQRSYIAQIQLYLLMTGNEVGCFILKNKQTGELKPIWCQIDIDFCDQIIKRAERVYKALAIETPPDRINDLDICSKCDFKHVCLPDLKAAANLQIIDNQEMSSLLDRRETLKPLAAEFEGIDEEVKKIAKTAGIGDKLCGDFVIRITEHERTTKVALTYTEEKTKYLKAQIVKI